MTATVVATVTVTMAAAVGESSSTDVLTLISGLGTLMESVGFALDVVVLFGSIFVSIIVVALAFVGFRSYPQFKKDVQANIKSQVAEAVKAATAKPNADAKPTPVTDEDIKASAVAAVAAAVSAANANSKKEGK